MMSHIAATTANRAKGTVCGVWCCGIVGTVAGLDATLIVRMVLNVPFAGNIPDIGLKLQERPDGNPGQLKLN
jgi:hypothetical protein